jgi:C4-dicarboxylate transporter DctM subunit
MEPPLPDLHAESAPPVTGWRRWLRGSENGVLIAALAVMVLLPCLEIVLRKVFRTGLGSSAPIVQHLVLAVGMLGGAIAARENRLLVISTLTMAFSERWKARAAWFSHGFAAAISALLAGASVVYLLQNRKLGAELASGVPVWVVQILLPLGFALIAVRLIWHAGKHWPARAWTLGIALAVLAAGHWLPVEPANLRLPGLLALLVATALGAPIFTVLGGAGLILLWSAGEPLAAMPLKHYSLTVNATLPSIPLFTLAGYFLAEGGAARRLVALFNACFSQFRGGPAVVTVLVCAFFTSFTGASGVTILALGGLLMPTLLSSGYRERSALGLLTGAGSLGLLFPPCLPPILYSIVASSSSKASVTMEQMFKGGLLPGLLMVGMVAVWGVWSGPKQAAGSQRFEARAAWTVAWEAKWELLIPVVALGALFGGFATPVEAAALTAAYAFVVETMVYRDLQLVRDVPRVMVECGLLVGGVLLILGVALGFTYFLIDAEIPDLAVRWVTAHVHSPLVFLLLVNLLLLVVGCLMDIYSAIVVVVPLLVPVAQAFGVDMVHLGIVFLANLELGYLTPPVGMNLFLSSYRFNKPVGEVVRASLPILGVLSLGVLCITYVPWLTTWLPNIWP